MKFRPFEIALAVVFGLLMLGSLFLLRTIEPEKDPEEIPFGAVTIWGTLPTGAMTAVLGALGQNDDNYQGVSYRYVSPEELSDRLIRAIADNQPPDLLLISQEELLGVVSRVQNIPYTSKPLTEYRSQFIDGAEIFLNEDGFFGYPMVVDPLMLYWNRDIFSANGLISAPVTWEEMIGDTIPSIVRLDNDLKVIQPAIALGGRDNISNYFPILSALLLQTGSRMVVRDDRGRYEIQLNFVPNTADRPLTQVVTFYSNFTAQTNTLYTWSDNLPLDREMFAGNDLGMYLGFGSEVKSIEERNPNLNFDLTVMPQGANATTKRTYGRFYAAFITVDARNKAGAYKVLGDLVSQSATKQLADATGMAPVHRSSLAAGTGSKYGAQVYSSALYARGWYNPEITKTNDIFSVMIDEVNDNRGNISGAVNDALERLERAYR